MTYSHTSVRLLKINNKMFHHSSTSNDIGFEAPAGASFPLNRLRLDPPFFWVASILPRLQIMQMTIFGFIVCCHEVCRLLSDECLGHRFFNSMYIFTFFSKHLLHHLSCVAPTILHGPPNLASVGRCKIKCCIGLKKPGGKIFSNLQITSGANSSISSSRPGDSYFAQRTCWGYD